jgi:hypothetical protein
MVGQPGFVDVAERLRDLPAKEARAAILDSWNRAT